MDQRVYAAWRALRRRYRADGPSGALRHIAERARAQVHERERHLVLCKELNDISVPVRRGRILVEPIERRHLPELRVLNQEREDLTGDVRFAGDLDEGYRGWIALRDGEPIGFYWWADPTMPPHREFRTVALGVQLGAGDVYGTDLYVAPDHRSGGIAAEFLYLVETGLRERGFERLWGTVDENNRPARWLYDSRGYTERWTVEGTRVLRRWHYRIAPVRS